MANNWTRLECEAITADYLDMLAKQSTGIQYSKTEHRRKLRAKLDNRSDGSIEFKHQNISAVLIHAGHPYVRGYKPAWNYQALLENVVLSVLEEKQQQLSLIEAALIDQQRIQGEVIEIAAVFEKPPERIPRSNINEPRFRSPRRINYAEREARKRELGEAGEAFIVKFEKVRLSELDRHDLVDDIEWTSKEKGDGTGYDIRSFNGNTDEEIFIEVKTTNSGKYQPFLISDNELQFSKEYPDHYSLYRVFQFGVSPLVFELKGPVEQHVDLAAKLFSASF